MTRVLHVVTGLDAGGAEQQLLLLTLHSDAEAAVLSLTRGGVVADRLRAAGVSVSTLGMRSNRDLLALPRLWRLMRRGRYDVVHLHLFRSLVFGAPTARLAGVRTVVYTEHSLNERLLEGRLVTWKVRLLLRLALSLVTTVVAVSQQVRARLLALGVPSARMLIVPNAVALNTGTCTREQARSRVGLPPGPRVMAVVGRVVAAKGIHELLDAVGPLLGPDLRLLVVGEGADRPALEARLAAERLADRVVLAGERGDVPDLLQGVDLLVSPSPEETFGLAVVEARLASVPVVYVSCPALEELGVPDPGATCVPADPAALRAAVIRHLEHEAARVPPPPELACRYDARAAGARLDRVYRRLHDVNLEQRTP